MCLNEAIQDLSYECDCSKNCTNTAVGVGSRCCGPDGLHSSPGVWLPRLISASLDLRPLFLCFFLRALENGLLDLVACLRPNHPRWISPLASLYPTQRHPRLLGPSQVGFRYR